ncbi:hypothetical protein K438DRAFT_1756592 [Mycena galopus ATCC 62051]|nr:hypothetical protein K438DRAFT_1756592 [Mycena galopus ATCC 62051]
MQNSVLAVITATAVLEGFLYGILKKPGYPSSHKRIWCDFVVISSTTIFAMCTAHWILTVVRYSHGLLSTPDIPSALHYFMDHSKIPQVIRIVLCELTLLVGDAVIVFRLWWIWNRDWRVALLPAFSWLALVDPPPPRLNLKSFVRLMPPLRASPASTRGSSHLPFFPSRRKTVVGAHPAACYRRARALKLEFGHIGTAEPSGINDHASLDSRGLPKRKVPVSAQHPGWPTTNWVLTAVTNLYCTALIAWKVWRTPQAVRGIGDGPFIPVLAILVESAAIWTAWLLFFAITNQTGSVLRLLATDLTPPVLAIATIFIYLRVELGSSSQTPTHAQAMTLTSPASIVLWGTTSVRAADTDLDGSGPPTTTMSRKSLSV